MERPANLKILGSENSFRQQPGRGLCIHAMEPFDERERTYRQHLLFRLILNRRKWSEQGASHALPDLLRHHTGQDGLLLRCIGSDDPYQDRSRQGHPHGHIQQDHLPPYRIFLPGEERRHHSKDER